MSSRHGSLPHGHRNRVAFDDALRNGLGIDEFARTRGVFAPERRGGGDDLEAAGASAGTRRTVRIDADVTELAGPATSAQHVAVDHQGGGDAGAEG